jgi:hypothetical protein
MTTQPAKPPPRGVRIASRMEAEYDMPHPIVARLALEVLWQQLFNAIPGRLAPEEERVESALLAMHAMLWERERAAAAETGQYAHYIILRPLNPLNMPSPEEVAAIRDAIATLDRHDLIARPWADEEPT